MNKNLKPSIYVEVPTESVRRFVTLRVFVAALGERVVPPGWSSARSP